MGSILEIGFLEILCALFILTWAFYKYCTWNYRYWADRGVPFKKPEFPFGSFKNVLLAEETVSQGHDKVYKQFSDQKYYGVIDFRVPALVVRDPELMKHILVKDFQYFTDKHILIGNPSESIGKHLLNLKGQEWKNMRSKLTPTFTSGKLKLMFALMEKCSEELKNQMENELKEKDVIDVKELLSRFTLEIIASCAFGIDTNLISEKNTKFFKIMSGAAKSTTWRYLKRLSLILFPGIFSLLKINLVKPEVRDFVTSVVRENVEHRKKHNVTRNDFMDLLINIKRKGVEANNDDENENPTDGDEGLSVEQMAAQTFVFFVAGFETASSLMAFCLYELSCSQNVQDTLYEELKKAVDNNEGKISYDMLTHCSYLGQVLNETLRLYGAIHVLSRICTQRYKLPGTDVIVEKGMKVNMPFFSIHHDPQYYPEPDAFRPERFAPEETALRHPFVFIPFGEGPRNCIGMRFGLMQARLGLATVLLDYRVELSPEQEVPIEIHKKAIGLMPAKPVLLKFIPRDVQL